jgi:hypothetical protein
MLSVCFFNLDDPLEVSYPTKIMAVFLIQELIKEYNGSEKYLLLWWRLNSKLRY